MTEPDVAFLTGLRDGAPELDTKSSAVLPDLRICGSCGVARHPAAFHRDRGRRRSVCADCRAGRPVALGSDGPLARLDPIVLVERYEALGADYRRRAIGWEHPEYREAREELAVRCRRHGSVCGLGTRYGYSRETGEAVRVRAMRAL